MIWIAMSCRCAAPLYFSPPNITMVGAKYMELLIEKPKLQMHIHGCMIFMQDGVPCHPSKVATEFLKQKNTYLLDWHWNSPYLNTIENMWTIMKDKVPYTQLSSVENLRQGIKMFGSLKSSRSTANLWLHCAFGEINLSNLAWRPKKTIKQNCPFYF